MKPPLPKGVSLLFFSPFTSMPLEEKKGTMGTEISILIDGAETKLHTSCSKPIGIEMIVGDVLKLTDGYSLEGGMLCEVPADSQDEDHQKKAPKPKKAKKKYRILIDRYQGHKAGF
jgi:hypothetical protein